MTNEAIADHIAAFASARDEEREAAREALVGLGSEAVPALIEALKDDVRRVQWEAAKALTSIADPVAGPALAQALEDNDLDIRWLASEGLVRLGDAGLIALLRHLTQTTDQHCHDAAILVLNRFRQPHGEVLAPVMEALRARTVDAPVMVAANKALADLGS